jgi:hypothetical protein
MGNIVIPLPFCKDTYMKFIKTIRSILFDLVSIILISLVGFVIGAVIGLIPTAITYSKYNPDYSMIIICGILGIIVIWIYCFIDSGRITFKFKSKKEDVRG